jgi:hypothetical protein
MDKGLSMENEAVSTELQSLLNQALECFQEADEGWSEIRRSAVDRLAFYNGDQWSREALADARLKRKPVLQENRLPVYGAQVENEMRQREMSINATALDETASDDTANIFTGIIRAIEADSHAKSAYIHAAGQQGALVPGFGFIKADIVSVKGQPQKIVIKQVNDPFKVLCDPSWQEPDMSDATYWFEFEDYTESSFARLFPNAKCSGKEFFPVGAASNGWLSQGMIRVARFWYKQEIAEVTYLLDDGTVVSEIIDEQTEDGKARYDWTGRDTEQGSLLDTLTGINQPVLRHREVLGAQIKWADMTGAEILDEGDWPGDYFPFSACTGVISIVNGRRMIRGITAFAEDSQRMLNFINTSLARRLAQANKSPWLMTKRMLKGNEGQWNTLNTQEYPYLVYNDTDDQGNTIPTIPQRADQTAQIQDLITAAQAYEDKLKATLGIFDAGLGATPNEQSGVAIKTLAQQGQNANYHFSDSVVRMLEHFGRILINLVVKTMDGPTAVRTLNIEGEGKLVRVNELFQENGKDKEYILTEGDYGVAVAVGPAYANQKQAAIEQMLELARANPNITPYIQDLIARNMDFPGKELVADRLKKVLAMASPQLIEGTPEAEIPPEALAALQQQKQMLDQQGQLIQQLTLANTELQADKAGKVTEYQLRGELLTLEQQKDIVVEEAKRQTQLMVGAQQQHADEERHQADLEMKRISAILAEQAAAMKLILEAVKQFGPMADEVIADVMPSAVNTLETAAAPPTI